MKRTPLTLIPAALAVLAIGCGGGDSSDDKVDAVIAEYQKLDVSDQEVDEIRDTINDALEVLPEDEHDEYLDTLLDSAKTSADAVEVDPATEEWNRQVEAWNDCLDAHSGEDVGCTYPDESLIGE